MKFGGMLAAGVGAGAGEVNKIAEGFVDQERRLTAAAILNEMEVEKANRIAEAAEQRRRAGNLHDLTDPELTAAQDGRTRSTQAIQTEGAVEREKALTPVHVDRAAAVAKAETDETTRRGGDAKYLGALRAIQRASEAPDRTDYKGRELDNAIKQMQVDNARRIETLKGEFATATPERQKAINDELQVLTGKDHDKFMPVPLKDETGAVTGYKIFDTRGGRFIDEGPKGAEGGSKLAVGAVVDGHRYKGGNPNDKASWEPVAAGGATTKAPTAAEPPAEPKKSPRVLLAERTMAIKQAKADPVLAPMIERYKAASGRTQLAMRHELDAALRKYGISSIDL